MGAVYVSESRDVPMIGEKFGRWTVLDVRKLRVVAKCECGNVKEVYKYDLKNGKSKSCGCLRAEITKASFETHGLYGNPLYKVWTCMIQRCTNPNNKDWARYGGRGITVCEEWLKSFVAFYNWAFLEYKKGLQLDREDNSKGYSPDNCRWITRKENCRNRRSNCSFFVDGTTMTVAEWSEITGIAAPTLYSRIQRGKIGAEILEPVKKRRGLNEQ